VVEFQAPPASPFLRTAKGERTDDRYEVGEGSGHAGLDQGQSFRLGRLQHVPDVVDRTGPVALLTESKRQRPRIDQELQGLELRCGRGQGATKIGQLFDV